MPLHQLLFALGAVQMVSAGYVFDANATAFKSAGGSADCVSANVPISFTATTTRLLVDEPANQTVVSEYLQELLQANSRIATTSNGGSVTKPGNYMIDMTYCVPSTHEETANRTQTIQILTHGVGLDKSYWDIADGNSHVDAAAVAGYATLAYNRLGVGSSDHPDPIQIVQSYTDLEVQHGIAQLLRSGFQNVSYTRVIGVGHSYGSIILLAQTAKYPTDVDGAVLTGFVNNVANLPNTVIANNPAIASINDPSRFLGLPYGYLVNDSPISVQLTFYRFPYFDQNVFNSQYKNKQTYSLGQQFTLPGLYSAAPSFTGPIDVVVGQNDFPFCLGQCDFPEDQASATVPALYPAAGNGSESYIIPNTGHCINGHYSAPKAFSQINAFLAKNGF